jgi:hypothetical protein
MVTLKNCQDYQEPPCRRWLEKAACKVGAHVAYANKSNILQDGRPDQMATQVTYSVMVAAYVSEIPPAEDDAVLNSKPVPCAGPDEQQTGEPEEEPAVQKCME